ncbi:MAG: FAD-dependent oxidoreductase [Burkholderiales bacterium]|nr:FAD-dependent oxidoreductase [Burkholderiales bacterium]
MTTASAARASQAQPHPHLLSPLRVGPLYLRNRLLMGSMHTRLVFEGEAAGALAEFYAERARGGAALIITGGIAPNPEGRMEPDAAVLDRESAIADHARIVAAVHHAGSPIVMQILHAGRYAKHADAVGPSAARAPINRFTPHRLSADDVERTVEDYVRCAALAHEAGYDGVDVMGSEGYLINQFTAPRTNDRRDDWGGSAEKRTRFAVEIVRRIRARLGPDFAILYRISALDLVENGAGADETVALAQALEAAGADALTTGIGWHESRVPTIAYMVPRGAWRFAAARLKRALAIPVAASNRINTPELAEELLARGEADLVALARPLLADPEFLRKAAAGRSAGIAPCIACNQACLDYIFTDRVATCLVNPRAGRETEYRAQPARRRERIAVAGSGPAGLAFAVTAASRGHAVTLFEAQASSGGQMRLACRIPGKEEFASLLSYYEFEAQRLGVELRMATAFDATIARAECFDRIVIATGVAPRKPRVAGIERANVRSYTEILTGAVDPGRRVAIIGAGAIAFDTAEYLTASASTGDPDTFYREWGVAANGDAPGGIVPAAPAPAARFVSVFQRTPGRPAARLGISTGWINRAALQRRGVIIVTGCEYLHIDDAGLHIAVDGKPRTIAVDDIVVCAGQDSLRPALSELEALGVPVHLIGGARDAVAIDARRAIEEGYRLALTC